MLKEIKSFLTFDNLSVLQSAQLAPRDFVFQLETPCVLDEVQRAPDLMLPLKEAIDQRKKPGQFVLTGSTHLLTRPQVSESLAGRMIIETLWPLSPQEIKGVKNNWIQDVFHKSPYEIFSKTSFETHQDTCQFILKGGYPIIWGLNLDQQNQWFQSYIQTMIERDLREITHYSDTIRMYNLFKYLILRSGCVLNVLDLSRSVKIPMSSLLLYLGALESIFLISRIPGWTRNRSKRLTKAHKLLLNDSGLFCYGVDLTEDNFKERSEWGFAVETFVYTEILKQLSWSSRKVGLFHYRTYEGKEVDFVLENAVQDIVGIEVKASRSLSSHATEGLKSLMQDAGEKFKAGFIFYMGDELLPVGFHLFAIPLKYLL